MPGVSTERARWLAAHILPLRQANDEALKYAPNWKQLKEAREVAAKQKI